MKCFAEMLLIQAIVFFLGFNAFAQKDLTYTNFKTARKNASKVYRLSLAGEKVENHLKHFHEFDSLEYLELSFCELDEYPKQILACKRLKYIDLSQNTITLLPENISDLADLEVLKMDENRLISIPESIGKCQKLKHLSLLGNTDLDSIPQQLSQLSSLEYLSCKVSKHEFTSIICTLANLKELVVYSNASDIVCDLVPLRELQRFTLILMQSTFIPFQCSLSELKNLKELTVNNLNCCWPYIEVSLEVENSMKVLLPEQCALKGFHKGGEVIESELNLR